MSVTGIANQMAKRPSEARMRQDPKLLDQMREALPSSNYRRCTEQPHCQWVKRYTDFDFLRHRAKIANAANGVVECKQSLAGFWSGEHRSELAFAVRSEEYDNARRKRLFREE